MVFNKNMVTEHFIKILILFTGMIVIGLISVSVSNYLNHPNTVSTSDIGLAE